MKKQEEIVDTCVDNILEDFQEKIEKIMAIEYHYNLFETFKNIDHLDETIQYRIYENLINNYLDKLKCLNYNKIMENLYDMEEILDFFDYQHFSNNNDDKKGYVKIEEEAEEVVDELLSKVLLSNNPKLSLPISIDNIKKFCISNIDNQEDMKKIFMWIILKLSVIYHYSFDKI